MHWINIFYSASQLAVPATVQESLECDLILPSENSAYAGCI